MYTPDFDLSWNLHSGLQQKIKKHEEWLLFSDITIHQEYRAGANYLLNQSKTRPVTFLDLGANVGFATWQFADALLSQKRSFRALLVEPNPDTFLELEERVKSQGTVFGPNIVVPICGLVGRRFGKAFLRTDGVHTISKAYQETEKGGFYLETGYIDIEDYLDQEPIDLIKMDIEGSEWDFVSNYPDLLSRTGCIIFEQHPDGEPEKVSQWLQDAGFTQYTTLRVKGNVSTQVYSRPGGTPINCTGTGA